MASIFISRAVNRELWFSRIGEQHFIVDQSLIEFSPVLFEMPEADWVFFYSKNGVKYFFEQQPAQLAPYRWAAFGKQTALALSQYVLDIDFIGDGVPKNTADKFLDVKGEHEKVCFVRAQNSKKSVQQFIDFSSIVDLVVYNNIPKKKIFSTNFDVLIFTSPLNVEAYFSVNSFHNESIIAIGETTAASLKPHVHCDILLSNEPSSRSLLDQLQTLF